MKRASGAGASIASRQLPSAAPAPSTCANDATVPTPSTWPVIRCPPSRSARRSAFSRLTSPGPSRPAVQAQRLRRDVELEAAPGARGRHGDHGQAAAVDRDAVAERDVVDRQRRRVDDDARRRRPRPRRRDPPHRLHDAGEHQPSSRRTRASIAQVGADALDAVEIEPRRAGRATRARRRRSAMPRAGSPSSARREIEQELVDESGGEQRAVEPRARLDVHLVAAARAPAPRISAARSTRPAPSGSASTSVVAGQPRLRAPAVTTSAPPPASTFAAGRRLRRAGRRRRAAAAAASRPRARSAAGSSSRTVPMPVSTAQARARQRVAVGARRLAGDPLAVAVRQRGAAVEARRHLQPHPRPAARHAARRSRG